MHPSIQRSQKMGKLINLALLVAGLWLSHVAATPVGAQGAGTLPAFAAEAAESDPQTDGAGYLHVHVYDATTQTPISGQLVSIFDRANVLFAQATTTCSGYVEFAGLPAGAYRVSLGAQQDWITVRRQHTPGQGRRTPGEWVWVRPDMRTGVYFYQTPNLRNAGLRVSAYHIRSRRAEVPRQPVSGVLITVHNSAGQLVASGTTGCGGFVDFTDLAPGPYRVAVAGEPSAAQVYPTSGERRVALQAGVWTQTWFFTVPPLGPQ